MDGYKKSYIEQKKPGPLPPNNQYIYLFIWNDRNQNSVC